MSTSEEQLKTLEGDDYDEELDDDFDDEDASDHLASSSESEEDKESSRAQFRAHKEHQAGGDNHPAKETIDLDSGDEATIEEKKAKRKTSSHTGQTEQADDSDSNDHEWRVKTRATREKDRADRKSVRLATATNSTIDVEKLWESMNRPGGSRKLAEILSKDPSQENPLIQQKNSEPLKVQANDDRNHSSGNDVHLRRSSEELVIIDETYEFAGQVHHEKRAVPKSSEQAKLWLREKASRNTDARFPGDEPIRKPLRRISRFDPNVDNLDHYKQRWEKTTQQGQKKKVGKLNTVEKSKLDWAAHVDQEGLQDELTEHAKTKGAYLARMDFLGHVQQRTNALGQRMNLED